MVRHKQNDGGVCHEQNSPSVSTIPVHLVSLQSSCPTTTTPPFCHELTKGDHQQKQVFTVIA